MLSRYWPIRRPFSRQQLLNRARIATSSLHLSRQSATGVGQRRSRHPGIPASRRPGVPGSPAPATHAGGGIGGAELRAQLWNDEEVSTSTMVMEPDIAGDGVVSVAVGA
jgi:hypothetical protein